MYKINEQTHDHLHTQNRHAVIPTTEKLNADPGFSGRGVTVAFLDSGYYPHPDFVGRVVAFHDIAEDESSIEAIREPAGHHWHGTQTVVACAGDGSLSDGIYRGLAHESSLVLVKVSVNGRIADGSIEKGLRWVIENRARHNIRVLNMSLGGDVDRPADESCINRLTEELVAEGVVVTVAAGNSSESRSIPPANAPSVITVGGYSDENQFSAENFDLYHSSFGVTADGLVKPEIIAPAMYVAAPILPDTPDFIAAETLSMLSHAPNYQFRSLVEEHWNAAGLERGVLEMSGVALRAAVENAMIKRKIVATHYQHVDGTSFAAPIVASVAAQMLEVNPGLTPLAIKNILISTAERLGGHPSIRQGYGVINAGRAIERAANEEHFLNADTYFPPRIDGTQIVFTHHDDDASSVALCGDFNGWQKDDIHFEKRDDGLWQASIACQRPGEYRYKLLIDDTRWIEDASHGLKEEDGFGGFNSILLIR